MQLAGFRDIRSKEELQKAADLANDLKNEKVLVDILAHNNVSLSQIDSHPYTIQTWYKKYQKCIRCTGLKNCAQDTSGYFDNIVDDGFLHTEKCACKYMRQRLSERKHLENFLINDMPEKLFTVQFTGIQVEKENNAYWKVLAECMAACNGGSGVYLYGTMGSGKTYLAACACNQFARNGKKVAFIHYPTFAQRIAGKVETGEYRSEVQKLMYASFVVMDDIGAESVTEWNRDTILLPILNARYEKGLPTWFTSNEDFTTLQEHFTFTKKGKIEEVKALRIMERMRSMAKPIALLGESRRQYLSRTPEE